MHRADHAQVRERGVRDLTLEQGPRDDAYDFSAGPEGGVGHDAHEANAPAAVDESDALCGQRPTERPGRLVVGGLGAGPGAAEDADASHPLARFVDVEENGLQAVLPDAGAVLDVARALEVGEGGLRSEEHTSELQSRQYLVCRLLLEKKNKYKIKINMKDMVDRAHRWNGNILVLVKMMT